MEAKSEDNVRRKNLYLYTCTLACFIPLCLSMIWSEEIRPLYFEHLQRWYYGNIELTHIPIPDYVVSTDIVASDCNALNHIKPNVITLVKSDGAPSYSSALCARTHQRAIMSGNQSKVVELLKKIYEVDRNFETLCIVDKIALSLFIPDGNITGTPRMEEMLDSINLTFLNSNNEYHQQLSYSTRDFNKGLNYFYNHVILPRLPTTKRESRILQRTINLVIVKVQSEAAIGHYIDRSQNTALIVFAKEDLESISQSAKNLLAEMCGLLGNWTDLERKAVNTIHRIVVDGKFQRIELSKYKRWYFSKCVQSESGFMFNRVNSCIAKMDVDNGDEILTQIFVFALDQKVGIYLPLFFPILTAVVAAWLKKPSTTVKEKKE